MDIVIDAGYTIISDAVRIPGGMEASRTAIGAILAVLVVTGIGIRQIFSRRAGEGRLFHLKSRSGPVRRRMSTRSLTWDAWCTRGERLAADGMDREALNAYDRAYSEEKQRPEVWYPSGRILFDLGNVRTGMGTGVPCAGRRSPRHAAVWILKVDLLCKKGSLTDARCCYRLAFWLQGQNEKFDLTEIWDNLPDDLYLISGNIVWKTGMGSGNR